MKKLCVSAIAVAIAICSHAAAVNWGSGTITLQGGTQAGKNDVTAYLFELTADQYSALSADQVYNTYKGSLASATATKSSTAKGVANLTGSDSYAQGDTAYAAILYVSSDGSYAIGNLASYTFASSVDGSVANLSIYQGGDSANGAVSWASTSGGGGDIPEPTSGLLLLVGAGMLALRRKQK